MTAGPVTRTGAVTSPGCKKDSRQNGRYFIILNGLVSRVQPGERVVSVSFFSRKNKSKKTLANEKKSPCCTTKERSDPFPRDPSQPWGEGGGVTDQAFLAGVVEVAEQVNHVYN